MNRSVHKLSLHIDMTPREESAFQEALGPAVTVKRGDILAKEGEQPQHCVVLLAGFVARQKQTLEGITQTTSFLVPGDFCDLPSLLLQPLGYSLVALDHCSVAYFLHSDIRALISEHPRFGYAFWRETLIEASIFSEWVTNIGARPAYSRIAHVLCELYVRLNAVGLASNFTFALPLTQQALAEATGLSAVHVNRTLSQLKRDRLVTMTSREVQLHKWVTLCEVADFDPAYLYSRAPANPRP